VEKMPCPPTLAPAVCPAGLAGPGARGAGPPPASSVVLGAVSRRPWSGRLVPPFRAVWGVSPSLPQGRWWR
jgi:hypothetical protein